MPQLSTNDYPIPNRFVTGHDADGKSIFLYEGPISCSKGPAPGSSDPVVMAVPWESNNPVDLLDDTDTANPGNKHLFNTNGHTARISISPPNSSSPMHRTGTIDYDVILSGEMELELEGGERRKLKAGDVIIQRGTLHAWHNTSDQPSNLLSIMISAELPSFGGKPVEATKYDVHQKKVSE